MKPRVDVDVDVDAYSFFATIIGRKTRLRHTIALCDSSLEVSVRL